MNSINSSNFIKVTFFCSDWGRTVSLDEFCRMAVDAGFDGIETGIPPDAGKSEQLAETLEKHGLEYILQCNAFSANFDDYLTAYREELEHAARLKPILINCHTGKDHFCYGQNEKLIAAADSISQLTGVPIVHETHRGRFPFAAHVTQEYLERLPALQLALDISHWCVVHESLLEDQAEAVSRALHHTSHIHARIGHTQGPQVNDPRAPEWQANLIQHLIWWDAVVARRRERQLPITITTEFGPPNYLPTLPYTQQPLANQWELNTYMLDLLGNRYNKKQNKTGRL